MGLGCERRLAIILELRDSRCRCYGYLPYRSCRIGCEARSGCTLRIAYLGSAGVDRAYRPGLRLPLTSVEIRSLGAAFDQQPAVPTRGIPFVVFGLGVGGPEQADTMRHYPARVIGRLEPWSSDRLFVNFLSEDEAINSEQVRTVYGV